MPQSLGIPVVSLAVPNIDKLKEITSDDLSCMWTVFTKCKDNLENGHRLENLSWRLWYRETRVSTEPIHIPQLQEAKKQKDNNEDCPSYASSTESSLVQTPPAFKHVSSSSFKRMITSFAESSPAPTLVMDTPAPVIDKVPEPPAQSSSKFFVSDDEDDDDEYEDYETGSEVENEDEVDNDNDDDDDDGCWSTVRSDSHLEEAYKAEFCKRTPTTPNRRSLLSNMLQTMAARTTTATTTTNVGATAAHVRPVPINRARRYRKRSVQPTHVVEPTSELSQSLKYCVEWEHRQNAVPIERPSHHTLSASSSPNWFLESFRGW